VPRRFLRDEDGDIGQGTGSLPLSGGLSRCGRGGEADVDLSEGAFGVSRVSDEHFNVDGTLIEAWASQSN
jgi:hypothetical protein